MRGFTDECVDHSIDLFARLPGGEAQHLGPFSRRRACLYIAQLGRRAYTLRTEAKGEAVLGSGQGQSDDAQVLEQEGLDVRRGHRPPHHCDQLPDGELAACRVLVVADEAPWGRFCKTSSTSSA